MDKTKVKKTKQITRHKRVRAKIIGTKKRPRLSVFRSNTGMYLQLIDDSTNKTLISAHSREITEKETKTVVSLELGKLIAKKAKNKKISQVVFDRGGYKYHGRVKAVADGAREGGLKF